eukprot:CAMPEP_0178660984 /NCGR_PEP_ID=MMETSP0698-20121128/27452_1 /TAXON_ID=265572 /ORGANISM="Extubocellulus spinifer, Strain CCMP396" /LENGTH=499 /DNA_ID=CAMNT_0020303749 /DNA_START=27 /DNA_END=1524 /DNA_ORIENTATION=-
MTSLAAADHLPSDAPQPADSSAGPIQPGRLPYEEHTDDEGNMDDEADTTDHGNPSSSTYSDVTIINGFVVVRKLFVPDEGFDIDFAIEVMGKEQVERVGLKSDNVTLCAALMMLDRNKYPSISRARKALRKGNILVHKGPLGIDDRGRRTIFDESKCERGLVSHRVQPNDVICEQAKLGNQQKLQKYPVEKGKRPPFELPVVYQDDHFAIVNKPGGVNVLFQKEQEDNEMCIKQAAPYVLKPPVCGTLNMLHRPSPVHRLDKPTSGLLLIAKTKPAKAELVRLFTERDVRKTYTAIINGRPTEFSEHTITSSQAHDLGVDVGYFGDRNAGKDIKWQLIDHALEDNDKKTKTAVTIWRPLQCVECSKAADGVLTLVELKPKSGRYHQLRRHMAWVCKRPLVGDRSYSGEIEFKHHFRDHGLYLCSNKVTLPHPYYNTTTGRMAWDAMKDSDPRKYVGGMIRLSADKRKVLVHAEIEVPARFQKLLDSPPEVEKEQTNDSS